MRAADIDARDHPRAPKDSGTSLPRRRPIVFARAAVEPSAASRPKDDDDLAAPVTPPPADPLSLKPRHEQLVSDPLIEILSIHRAMSSRCRRSATRARREERRGN